MTMRDLYQEKTKNIRNLRVDKVVVNCGIGRLTASNPQNKDKILADTEKILALITGQKPAPRPAKKSIAAFKVRQGETVGYAVTLRGKRMFDFISRMVNLALPRVRDFRGIPLSNVDKHGNLSIGFSEHIVFPEVAGEDVRQLYGLQVTLVPSLGKREKAIELYRAIGIPLQRE
jgi:large subunit ribosomal protein L5